MYTSNSNYLCRGIPRFYRQFTKWHLYINMCDNELSQLVYGSTVIVSIQEHLTELTE